MKFGFKDVHRRLQGNDRKRASHKYIYHIQGKQFLNENERTARFYEGYDGIG